MDGTYYKQKVATKKSIVNKHKLIQFTTFYFQNYALTVHRLTQVGLDSGLAHSRQDLHFTF